MKKQTNLRVGDKTYPFVNQTAKRRIFAGLCTSCGKVAPAANSRRCIECGDIHNERTRRYYDRKRAELAMGR